MSTEEPLVRYRRLVGEPPDETIRRALEPSYESTPELYRLLYGASSDYQFMCSIEFLLDEAGSYHQEKPGKP